MAGSIKTNYIYTLVNTISGMVFPLITFPYVSRVLMADGIGIVSFFNTIIGYIILLTSLGIPTYGIREIARVRNSIHETNKTAKEILYLHLILSLFGYIIIIVFCFSLPQIKENLALFILLSSSIFLTAIGCPWFFSGVEDFKFITIRGLAVRVVCIILLFMFVKTKKDLIYYGAYTVLASVGNNIINLIWLKCKYMSRDKVNFSELNLIRHIKPALQIFLFNLITSIYLKIDIVMLGFMKDNASVGYYTSASNLVHIFISLVNALGQVTLPRLSNLYANKDYENFKRLSEKVYKFILMIVFPLLSGLIVMAPVLIEIFCGSEFYPAINTVKILSVVIFSIGLSNLFGMQILYPMGKINIVNLSVFVGAIVNFSLNLLLIPYYSQNGAAYATIFAESSVTLTQVILARRYLPFKIFSFKYMPYVLGSILLFVLCYHTGEYVSIFILKLICVPIVGVVSYIGVLILFRDSLFFEICGVLKNKIIASKR